LPDRPLVSIVTPVYQMARFIADTLDSVFRQDYPHIEYLVLDAGSTDGTLEILRRYEQAQPANVRFRWFSSPDAGTADAINKGLERSTGSIFAYLNADDTYTPTAVSDAVNALIADPSAAAVYGEADWINENGTVLGRYPTRPFDPQMLRSECFICQPACFIRRDALADAGAFDTSLSYAYDYDFWIRLSCRHRMIHVGKVLAASRMHLENKTLGERRNVLRENIAILRRHFDYAPFSHILAYSAHMIDGRDQFFAPFRPSIGKYLFSLPVGLRFNWRHPFRYTKEWFSVLTSR
jgi:glycosyltransferase involved in cell wall biosynthesis